MLRFEPAKPHMIADIRIHAFQVGDVMSDAVFVKLCEAGQAVAGIGEDGRAYLLAGVFEVWPGRVIAWSIWDHEAGRYAVQILRATKRVLDSREEPRVEAYSRVNNPAAERMFSLLGFRREGVMAKFLRDEDYVLWARSGGNVRNSGAGVGGGGR